MTNWIHIIAYSQSDTKSSDQIIIKKLQVITQNTSNRLKTAFKTIVAIYPSQYRWNS